MGLSLKNIGKKLTDVLGGAERQVNPFDNGATYSNPQGNGQQKSVVQQINESRALNNPFTRAADATGNFVGGKVVPTIINTAINIPVSAYKGVETLGKGINQHLQAGEQQSQLDGALKQIDDSDAQAQAAFHAGKIDSTRLGKILKSNQADRQSSVDAFKGKIAAAPSGKQFLAAEGQTGLNLLGASGYAGAGAAEVAAPSTLGSVIKQGAEQGALYGAGNQGLTAYGDNKSIKDVVKESAIGGLSGAALGGALGAAGYGIGKLVESPQLNNERGSVEIPGGKNADELAAGSAKSIREANAATAETDALLKPTPKEISEGASIGMTPDEVAKAKVGMTDPTEISSPTTKMKVKAKGTLDATSKLQEDLNSGTNVSEALYNYMQDTGQTYGQAQDALKEAFGSKSLNKGQVNASLNPQKGMTLGAVTEGDASQPILNSRAVRQTVVERGNDALGAIQNLSDGDAALLDKLRTTKAADLASQADDPAAFKAAADAVKNYNDFTHATGSKVLGQNVPYRQDYGAPLLYENSPEEIANAQRVALKNNPGYSKSRGFSSYEDAAQYGLARRNDSFAQDLAFDVQRRSSDLSQLALAKGLEDAYPGQVRVGSIGSGPGGVYKQLDIAGGNRLSLPGDIADDLNKRAAPADTTGALKAYDQLNGYLKYYKLGGGTFHGLTTAGTVAGQQLTSGNLFMHPIDNLKMIAGTLSDSAHQSNMQTFDDAGVTGFSRLTGTSLSPEQILGDANPGSAVTNTPVLKQLHDAVFGRQIPEAKLTIMQQQMESKFPGMDFNNPTAEQVDFGRGVSRAVNNLGGINRAVDGLTPQQAKNLSRVVLATDFTEGKMRTIVNAVSKGGPEGNIARQMVVGKTLVFLLPTVAVASAQGKIDWSDPKNVGAFIGNQILDPNFSTGLKGNTGIARIAKTPETFVSELGRIIKPMFDGSADKTSGLKHYAGARLAALPSVAEQIGTNQDYQGNPIINRNPDGGINLEKTAAQVGVNSAPIPIAQAIKGAEVLRDQNNKRSVKDIVAEGVLNTVGLRTGADPRDPQMKAFAFETKSTQGLSSDDRKLWDQVYGKNVDKYGNAVTSVPALDSQNKAYTLLTNPQLLDTGKKINDYKKTQGLPGDPFFDLNRDQQKVVLNLAVDKFRNPAERTVLKDQNPWLGDYNNARSAYFDALHLPPSSKTKELPEPQAPSSISGYSALSDAAQKSQYLQDHPEITDYFTAHDNFIRAGRAKQGLPQYDNYPSPDAATQRLMDTYNALPKAEANGKSKIRSAWIKAHPDEWAQMTAQFSKQAQYGLQNDAQRAAYQGEDFSAKGIKDIVSLASDLGVSGGSSGSSFKFGSSGPSQDPYKYAVSLTAGGSGGKKPRVSVKGAAKKIAKKTVSQPKVSIKKSVV